MKLIQKHRDKIIILCKKHLVKELYAFGSVLTPSFSKESDVDFLVRFGNVNRLDYFDNYMDLKEALENLLKRSVELLETQTLKNPILKRSIKRNKHIIYGRADSEMAL